MPHVLQAVKSAGGTISRAELLTFLDNLEWFRTPPAYRLYVSVGNDVVTTSLGVMDWTPGGAHYEWREGGGGNPDDDTFTTGSGGLWVNVGDVAAGVWLNGVMLAIRNTPTLFSGQSTRQVRLRRGDGSTFTELADSTARGDNGLKRTAFTIAGLGTFSAGTDRVDVQARLSGSGTADVLADRRWGVRTGSQTNYTPSYSAARQVSDTNSEAINAFNRLRTNQYRIETRPSAQRWKSGSAQSLTAGVAATVSLASSDWSTPAAMTVNADRIDIEVSGLYLVTGQVTHDSYDSGGSFAEVTLQHVTGEDVVTASSANAAESEAYDTVASACDLVQIDAGRYVRMLARSGTDSSVQASRGTQLTATLMSSNSGVSPGRQVFARMPDPDTWPDVANMSSDHSPVGTMRVLSDLTDRQWHKPAFKATLTDDAAVSMSDGWTDIDMDNLSIDYTSLESVHGITVLSGGALVLPWPGIWLVGARLSFGSTAVDGDAIGAVGWRGMRITLNKSASVAPILTKAMNANGHGWTRTLMETVVTNRADVEVRLQGIAAPEGAETAGLVAAAATDTASLITAVSNLAERSVETEFEVPVNAAHLWCVEQGEGITRDPS